MIFVSAFLFRLIVQRCLTSDAIDNIQMPSCSAGQRKKISDGGHHLRVVILER
jgi:hypothetical protein